jgi:hypothetical protein
MNVELLHFFALAGGALSAVAGLMAYLITYKEYIHHFNNNKQPMKLALSAAITTFIFFMVLSFAIYFFSTK